MKGFMTLKGYMKAFMRLINPFQGFIILRLFFTVYSVRQQKQDKKNGGRREGKSSDRSINIDTVNLKIS